MTGGAQTPERRFDEGTHDKIWILRAGSVRILFCLVFALSLLSLISAGAEIYIPDDYTSIQEAINAAEIGDILILRNGTYRENIVINKSIALRSESGASYCMLSDNDEIEAVISVTANGVEIRNITIIAEYSGYGVIFRESENSILADCRVSGGWGGGVGLYSANGITIERNDVRSISGIAIELVSSAGNNIVENNIHESKNGLRIDASSAANVIASNNITGMLYSDSYGILAYNQSNVFYLNRFSSNAYDAIECGSNIWNSTVKRIYSFKGSSYENFTGNYWGGYSGSDGNDDGIGDEPYRIPSAFGTGEMGVVCLTESYDYHPMLQETAAPPTISSIVESGLTNSSVTISWITNIQTNSRIRYGTDPDLSSGAWSAWANSTTSPSITLLGLTGNTTYYYAAYSHRIDDESIYANSTLRNFTTLRDPATLYVDDDKKECPEASYTSISEAVSAANSGDTIIVCNGTYTGNIVVDKTLNITGIGTPIVDAGHLSGFILASSNNVIQGFIVRDAWDAGIKVCGSGLFTQSHNNVISGNRIENSTKGVHVSCTVSSTNNLIERNTFMNSNVVLFESARSNRILNNTFETTTYVQDVIGIRCRNGCGGLYFPITTSHTIGNNTITSTPAETPPVMIYIEDKLDGNTIVENTLTGPGTGIRVESDYNRILRNTVTGGSWQFDPDDVGIMVYLGNDGILESNTVRLKSTGIEITPYSPSRSVNISMRNNTMEDNDYNFFIAPHTTSIEEEYPTKYDLDMEVDTSNVVKKSGDVRRIYYIKDARNRVFDYDDAGFFACIDCDNITIKYLAPRGNSHGILLHSVRNSSVENIYSFNNYLAGIAIYDSSNLTIRDSRSMNNGHYRGSPDAGAGIYLARSHGITLESNEFETNWCYGVWMGRTNVCIISGNNITDNGPSSYYPPAIDPCRSGSGLYLYDSDDNGIARNFVRAITNPVDSRDPFWAGGQKYGIYIDSSSNSNTIYDNYFENIVNARDTGGNVYNITRTQGRNIVGGPYMGGNYWHDYAGEDTIGGDGLGDTLIPYDCQGNITHGGDYHPLTGVVPDTTPPSIIVISPVEGKTYTTNYVLLRVYSPDPDVHAWWYSLNGGANISFVPNTTITGLVDGDYTLVVHLNDTAGNENHTIVRFSVNLTGETGGGGGIEMASDGAEPLSETPEKFEFEIEIISPESIAYTPRDLELRIRASVPLRKAEFILDDLEPVILELSPSRTSATARIERLFLGEHRLLVRGVDYYGRWGSGEVTFSIVPLALNEVVTAGASTTPRYVDDVVFSFYGRPVDHVLAFEARGVGELELFLNRYFRDGMQNYMEAEGYEIGVISLAPDWRFYEFRMPAESVSTDAENIVSFVSRNAWSGDEEEWAVRNISIYPEFKWGLPQVRVGSLERAISGNERARLLVRIDGIDSEEEYDAYLYLLTPDGRRLYYPDWSEKERRLDPYYLRINYYGRLPTLLKFEADFEPGIYTLVGKIARRGFSAPVALSTEHLYHSNMTSVRILLNRDLFSNGQIARIEHMMTTNTASNGTLLLTIEDPDGNIFSLPELAQTIEGRRYAPLASDHLVCLEREVDRGWREGTYILRSQLYDEEGNELAYDARTFEVCRRNAVVSGIYLRSENEPDASPIVQARIRMIDFYTLEMLEWEFAGDHASYSIELPPGRYFMTGDFQSQKGGTFITPMVPISLGCGETLHRNMVLERFGSIGTKAAGMASNSEISTEPSIAIRFESNGVQTVFQDTEGGCSRPKVFVSVLLSEDALEMLQERPDFRELTPEGIKKYLSMRLAQFLRRVSPEVEIYSYEEAGHALGEVEQYLAKNPGGGADTSKLAPFVDIEYAYTARVELQGYDYSVFSNLVERTTHLISGGIWRGARGDDPEEILDGIVNTHGDLGRIIEEWETRHPVPPRDPRMEVNVDPSAVSPESELTRKAFILVSVKDCRGRPAVGPGDKQKVFFQRKTTRGEVKTLFGAEAYDMLQEKAYSAKEWAMDFVQGERGGVAHGHYTLTKGTEAGEDTVTIVTYGIGMRKATATARIKIKGIGIEVEPEKSEIAPLQETAISIRLFEEDADGNKKPLEGRAINLAKSQLLDGRLLTSGPADGAGNPITDATGTARARYLAGKKKGGARIVAEYIAESPLHAGDPPRGETLIRVREEEYIVKIRWREGGDLHSTKVLAEAQENDPHNADTRRQDSSTRFFLESTILWERLSGRETTSASLSYDHDTIMSYVEYDRCAYGYWTEVDYYHCDALFSGVSTSKSHITSNLDRFESYRRVVQEDRAGNLVIEINPIRFSMPLDGRDEYRWDSSYQNVRYACREAYPYALSGELVFDRKGEWYMPAPPRDASCISRLGHCNYNVPDGFPVRSVVLERKGKNSFGSFHFSIPVSGHRVKTDWDCFYCYTGMWIYTPWWDCHKYLYTSDFDSEKEFDISVVRR